MITLIMHDSGKFPYYPEHWADVRSAFDIPFIYKIGGNSAKGFVHIESGTQSALLKALDNKICVMVTPAEVISEKLDAVELQCYEHAENVAYIFGPDDDQRGWHRQWDVAVDYVTIRTPSATELYASHAAAMVLYDRLRKGD